MAPITLARQARNLLAQARARTAADDPLLPDLPQDPATALAEATVAEALPLAQEMRAAFARQVSDYMRASKASLQEALAAVDRPLTPEAQEGILQQHPRGVGWPDLERLADRDPELALQKWEEIKQAAREELKSGLRAAEALGGSPQERARFLAIRQALAGQWQPRGGLEWQLIDMLAQALASWLTWLHGMTLFAGTDSLLDTGLGSKGRPRETTPRLTTAEALAQAATLADRFNGIALRTLRSLCGLRRYGPTVVVQRAAQVNVGRQQVNVAGACPAAGTERQATGAAVREGAG
jgi:hypothetical protein